MAKLNQLILLENMMRTYDAMNIKDANLTHFQGGMYHEAGGRNQWQTGATGGEQGADELQERAAAFADS